MVIYPGTGKTHTIFPERWGLEEALTWLERGECLLTSGLVYPRLDLSFTKEPTVSIFMTEHDLQRLMAKQEVKQLTRLAEAKIEPEFRRWREKHPNGYIPTESEDIAHMKQFGVGRDTVRELREKYPKRPRGQKKSDKPPNIRG